MQYLTLIGTVTFIHLLAIISPGPDFIMVVKNSLTYSRKTGSWTAIGLGVGVSVHIFYCIAGLAMIISQAIFIFDIIKLLGAGYLVYFGLKSIFLKSSNLEIEVTQQQINISPLNAIKIGFFTNLLNPKSTLFFLSLFTMVIDPETPNLILAMLSIIMILNTVLWFFLVSIFLTQIKIKNFYNKFQKILNKGLGWILIALGIKIALTQR